VASYGTIPVTDPVGPDNGSYRAARGGSWLTGASVMRAAKRLQPGHATASLRERNVGFRLALRDLNKAPTELNSTAVLAFQENQPVGTIIDELNATDPDANSSISYHFVNGENNNSLFTLDTNGTLKTATTFDYESNASNYKITVQAKDELNATTEGNFKVSLLNVNEPPSYISASNLTIAENSAIGTVIGEFNATDPDRVSNITFSLVAPLPSDLNLSLWLDASDLSTITRSNGLVSKWADKSGKGNTLFNRLILESPPSLKQTHYLTINLRLKATPRKEK